MAICKLCFSMDTSYGGSWELAMDSDRQWWSREYRYNGYGKGWSKWEKHDPVKVTFGIVSLTMYDGSIRRDRVAVVENGFSSDKMCLLSRNLKRAEKINYRFPKLMAA